MSKVMGIMLVLLVATVMLAGCGGSAPAGADGQKAVCSSLSGLKTSAADFNKLSADTKVSDIKALKAKLDGPVQAVKMANQALKLSQVDALTAAYDGLAKSIDGLSGDSLGAASAQLQTGTAAMSAALDQASAALKCGQ